MGREALSGVVPNLRKLFCENPKKDVAPSLKLELGRRMDRQERLRDSSNDLTELNWIEWLNKWRNMNMNSIGCSLDGLFSTGQTSIISVFEACWGWTLKIIDWHALHAAWATYVGRKIWAAISGGRMVEVVEVVAVVVVVGGDVCNCHEDFWLSVLHCWTPSSRHLKLAQKR